MLPNPKNNKNINNLLTKPTEPVVNEAEVNQKKLQTKRRTIIFSLALTAGLSLLFWSYKHIQSIAKSPPQLNFSMNFKLPKLSFLQNNQSALPSSENLSKYLEKSPIVWSIFVSLDTNYSTAVFEHQSNLLKIDNNLNQIVDKLTTTKITPQSLINPSLPQGLSFQEIIDSSNGSYYQGLIHLPKNKILILIKNEDLTNASQVQAELPLLIDHLYWYAVSFLD